MKRHILTDNFPLSKLQPQDERAVAENTGNTLSDKCLTQSKAYQAQVSNFNAKRCVKAFTQIGTLFMHLIEVPFFMLGTLNTYSLTIFTGERTFLGYILSVGHIIQM